MMTSVRRMTIVRIVLVLALGAVALSLTALPSYAGQWSCPDNFFCVWKNASFGGDMLYTDLDMNALSPIGFNDNISSAFNRFDHTYRGFQHNDCAGISQTFTAGLADSQVNRNDDWSSLDNSQMSACV